MAFHSNRCHFILASLCAITASGSTLASVTDTAKSCAAYGTYGLLGASIYQFETRRPDTKDVLYNNKRLIASYNGSIAQENQQCTGVILGFDSAHKLKKSPDTVLIGIYDTINKTVIGLTKATLNIDKSSKKNLLKELQKHVITEKPKNVSIMPGLEPDYWLEPSCFCTFSLFALRPAAKSTHIPYTCIAPEFIDLADPTALENITSVHHLRSLYTNQAVHPHQIAHELWLYLYDGLIGHKSKSASPRVDLDTRKIVPGEDVSAKGIYGTISDKIKPIGVTLAFLGALKVIQNADVKTAAENLSKKEEFGKMKKQLADIVGPLLYKLLGMAPAIPLEIE